MKCPSQKWIVYALATLLVLLSIVAWRCLLGWDVPKESTPIPHSPRILPDYAGVAIPPNIAPLNFMIQEPGIEYRVHIRGAGGTDIIVGSRHPGVIISPQSWRRLLRDNRGGRITFDVYAKNRDGSWSRFAPFSEDIAQEEIDSHLVYRLLGPVCVLYRDMGIYQRNLENFDESPILTCDEVVVCMNCHSFQNNRPEVFSIQVRPSRDKIQAGMIEVRNGHARRLKTQSKATPRPPAYTSWHPKGSVAAFAMIHPKQCFRGAGADVRDVFDADADLAAVNVANGSASTSPGIADRDKLETFPNWSSDGRTLYFCSAEPPWNKDNPTTVQAIKLKYDLMRVPYDIEKDVWGTPETMLSSRETGMSISEPRASPDGRYLLFCMADYGTFPVHRPSSDLYLMDLKTRQHRRLECNSPESESWHGWSSNSRWIVFSSKRDNGFLARPYFCYIDVQGREHKPFVLPQKDPAFYDQWLKTYNVPELVSGPIAISEQDLAKAVRADGVPNSQR